MNPWTSSSPSHSDKIAGTLTYYWVTAQAEYATDVVFTSRRGLEELRPRLVEHSCLHFSTRDVISFLGRKAG